MRLGLGIRRALAKKPLDAAQVSWPFDIYRWFAELDRSQWVLDIGSGEGSFPWTDGCHMVALDDNVDAFRAVPERSSPLCHRVFGSSGRLPLADRSFDLVLCHHVLEHVDAVDEVLAEIARVLKPDGRLYVAVPNGHGLCDAVYRYVFEGGGHVNRFAREPLAARIEQAVGVRLVRWQKLYSSFAYLRRLTRLPPGDLSGRLRALRRFPRFIGAAQRLLYLGTRAADRLFGSDLAVYGWALYFDRTAARPVEERAFVNVCLYCGAGHHALTLARPYRWRYRCQVCDRVNPYVRPFGFTT